jgi:hypothetical protein
MFRQSKSQTSFFDPWFGMTDAKRSRLDQTWAPIFRARVIPLIDETAFAHFYCPDNGRPNSPIRDVVSVLLLKEWFDLTDEEALGSLEYDLRWHVALGIEPSSAHLCQKTLHNFRVHLEEDEMACVLFIMLTDGLRGELAEVSTAKQRLDSTHIRSHFARLSRLGVFCETLRVQLRALRREAPAVLETLPVSLRLRYLRDDGTDSSYDDARASDSRRRLGVSARDAYRVREALRGVALPAAAADAYLLVERLVADHCEIVTVPQASADGDGDADLAPVPVVAKEAKALTGAVLQTPHDPDVTYGHKGQGYEVQVVETHGNGELPELILHVEVTPSCGSDQTITVPIVEALAARGILPAELTVDTGYASTENVLACAKQGVELLGPVGGPTVEPTTAEQVLGAFHVPIAPDEPPAECPWGVEALRDARDMRPANAGGTGLVQLVFSAAACATCPLQAHCPVTPGENPATVELLTTVTEATLAWRRQAEGTEEFRKAYARRAGCEATNSELKRGQGLGTLRVRSAPRVRLAVFLKALACNVKRALLYWQDTRKQRNQPAVFAVCIVFTLINVIKVVTREYGRTSVACLARG